VIFLFSVNPEQAQAETIASEGFCQVSFKRLVPEGF
jgi:hypothetical protein